MLRRPLRSTLCRYTTVFGCFFDDVADRARSVVVIAGAVSESPGVGGGPGAGMRGAAQVQPGDAITLTTEDRAPRCMRVAIVSNAIRCHRAGSGGFLYDIADR